MKLSVAIPTLGRKDLVTRILGHLEHQTRPPDEVVISSPDSTHVDQAVSFKFPVRFVFGKRGLCAQRNRALEDVLGNTDIVVFFDDDFIPASDYLEIVERGFEQNPSWVAISGRIAKDGAKHGGYTFEQGLEVLRSAELERPKVLQVTDHVGANGANMSLRVTAIGPVRFDERLVLHGWHEDIDMTSQLRPKGRIVGLNTAIGVHLGVRGGKASGVPFGYSQVINIVYLVRKGTVPLSFGAKVMARNVTANLAKSFWSEPHIDRRGRLKGNLLGAYDALRGRIEPEHILALMR